MSERHFIWIDDVWMSKEGAGGMYAGIKVAHNIQAISVLTMRGYSGMEA